MSDESFKRRYETASAIKKLTSLLKLTDYPGMQDWAVECADANRVEEFLERYEQGDLNEDERFALMQLIVASFDDWLRKHQENDPLTQRLRHHLQKEFLLHQTTVHYWCLLDEPDLENVFHITPLMRSIWHQPR